MSVSSKVQVLAMGTCNIDFILKVPRIAEEDDEVDVERLSISVGGSAANFAIGLSRSGIKTGILACIGRDYYGRHVLEVLLSEKVNTSQLHQIAHPTGKAFISVTNEGERSIYSFMGANSFLELAKEDIEFIKNTPLLHLTGLNWEVMEEAAKHAQILSLSPGTILSYYGLEHLKNILEKAHILFLNQKEVTLLTGLPWSPGAKLLVDRGVSMVVITRGKEGSSLFQEEGRIDANAMASKIKDTTGAGDSFAAGFIAAYVKNKTPQECLKSAHHLAAQCISRWGAQ